jgi:hypothetical protein
VNSKQLRQSLRLKWLTYYRDNRDWIDKLGIWITSDGQRRPSSGFILASLAAIEPNLNNLLPLVVDLSSNPDRIITVLGLNFSPDKELKALLEAQKMLPGATQTKLDEVQAESPNAATQTESPIPVKIEKPELASKVYKPSPPKCRDEDCTGSGGREDDRPRQ